jgi:hypothetical protein
MKVFHTRKGLKSSRRLLLQVFADIVRKEKTMHIALIAQKILAVRANGSIKMVLDL